MNLKEGLEFIDNIEELSAMPALAMDVMAMVNDMNTSVNDIAQKVRLDQAMVSFLLKACNSPLYGVRQEVTNINRAINLLGYSTIKSILMSYFNRNLYQLSGKNEVKDSLWKHSVAVAVFSRNLCSKLKMDPEDGYVAGLLHDIGKMVLYLDDPDKYSEIVQRVENKETPDFITAEKELLGMTHVETGYFLLEKWKFSQLLKDVVLYHHELKLFVGDDQIIGLVTFADQLTHVFLEKRFDDLDPFMEQFGMSGSDVDQVVEASQPEIEEFYSILSH